MEGKETYRFATRTLATTALESIERGRPRARRHRPVHPAPGQHPDHRGGRQGPRPADGPDVRQPRPVREHVGRVGSDRARRGGQRGPREGRRQHRASSRSGRASRSGAVTMQWTADPARGAPATRPSSRGRPRPHAGRLGLGRSDPGRARARSCAGRARSTRRSTTSFPASRSTRASRRQRGGPR